MAHENAEFIVHAANNHDTLIQALKDIRTGLLDARKHYGCTSPHCSGTCHFCGAIRRADAALQDPPRLIGEQI